MKLSFVIPAFNEENYLGKCLDSIRPQALKYQGQVEIIVVNNASTDRTRALAASYSEVKVVDEPKKGLVWARQAGFKVSTGELIANVDADTILTPGWLDKVFQEFSLDSELAGLSGPFKYYDLPKRLIFWMPIFHGITYLTYLVNRFILRAGSMMQGGNFIVTRSGLQKIGGYDTTIEFYGEDADIARRLNKIGRVKYTLRLPIYASGRRLAKEGMFTMAIRYGANYLSMIFFKKPISKKYIDIRPEEKNGLLIYQPINKKRELMTVVATLSILIIMVAMAGSAFYYLSTQTIFPALTISEAKATTTKFHHELSSRLARISQKTRKQIETTFKKFDLD